MNASVGGGGGHERRPQYLIGGVRAGGDAACHRIITDIHFCKHWSTDADSYRFFKDDQSGRSSLGHNKMLTDILLLSGPANFHIRFRVRKMTLAEEPSTMRTGQRQQYMSGRRLWRE